MTDIIDKIWPLLMAQKLSLVTAESCTGGLISAMITERSGSSLVFERGFVTYSNDSKAELLDVSREILETDGAVSHKCAEAMVRGALNNSKAGIGVSVTGIAGPDGGTEDKPVGLVYIGYALRGGQVNVVRHNFAGDRASVRSQTVEAALTHVLELITTNGPKET